MAEFVIRELVGGENLEVLTGNRPTHLGADIDVRLTMVGRATAIFRTERRFRHGDIVTVGGYEFEVFEIHQTQPTLWLVEMVETDGSFSRRRAKGS